MREVRAFEATDLDEAIRAAARDLGVEADALQYEVSDEGAKGFLGVGSRPVRIVVTLPLDEKTEKAGEDTTIEEEIVAFQEDILRLMGLDISVEIDVSNENVDVSLSGSDRDMVLQNRAGLLEAFQYLLNRIFGRRLENQRVIVDCGGFRKRKEEELRSIAKRASEKVKLTGMVQELGLMNPYERRIVHLAVGEEKGVASESGGAGFLKRVLIFPAS